MRELKNISVTLLCLLFVINLSGQNKSKWHQVGDLPIAINTKIKDFGVVTQGSNVSFKFKIKNTGDKPFAIWHVSASCGCTTTSWTKKPIKKGGTAIVKVIYDSWETGKFIKPVYVYTTVADNPIKLTIKGTVVKDKSQNNISKKSTNFKGDFPKTKN